MAARVEDALVLGLRGDDVALLLPVEMHDALDGDVVALGGAGGKDNLLRRRADKVSDLRARVLDRSVGLPAEQVGTGVRVSVLRQIERHHRVEDTRIDRRSRLHVEIERAAGDSHAFHGDSVCRLLPGIRSGGSGGGGGGRHGPEIGKDGAGGGGSLERMAEIGNEELRRH
ncbi:hypothetical protein TIFTF001_004558 [Ficus carica]|uniref:Uncharacterized protein n=1 Tax=Ficus carica TaxID=3494 RepID=A0AA87ZGK6_FICCA|nr:hypothetical protein TIFTF001_004558 [Ficus carica]